MAERETQETPFVLLPGAGGMAWYWHRVSLLLKQAHHEPIAINLPSDDASASLSDYADAAVRAIGKRANVSSLRSRLADSQLHSFALGRQSRCLCSLTP